MTNTQSRPKLAAEKITKGQIDQARAQGITHAKFRNKGVQKRLQKNQQKIQRAQNLRQAMIEKTNKQRTAAARAVSPATAQESKIPITSAMSDSLQVRPFSGIFEGDVPGNEAVCTIDVETGSVADAASRVLQDSLVQSMKDTAAAKPTTSMYANLAKALLVDGKPIVTDSLTPIVDGTDASRKEHLLSDEHHASQHSEMENLYPGQVAVIGGGTVTEAVMQQQLGRGERIKQAGITMIEEDGSPIPVPFVGIVDVPEVLDVTGTFNLGETPLREHILNNDVAKMYPGNPFEFSRPVEESITEDQARQANQVDALNPPVLDNLCEKLHSERAAEAARYDSTFESESGVQEDGIVTDPNALANFEFKKFDPKAEPDFGNSPYPLDLYGSEKNE